MMDMFLESGPVIAKDLLTFFCFIIPLRHQSFFLKRSLCAAAAYIGVYAALLSVCSEITMPGGVLLQFIICMAGFFLTEGSVLSHMYLTVWIVMVQGMIQMLWEAVQDFVLNAGNMLLEKFFLGTAAPLLYIVFAVLLLLPVYFFFSTRMPVKGTYEAGPRQTFSVVLILLLFDMIQFRFFMFGAVPWDETGSFLSVFLGFYCLLFLYLQFALFKESAMEKELILMNLLARKQKEQYELSRENIALINRKTHDLKHQIQALRKMDDSKRRGEYLDEIDGSIQIYESIIKTGCEVLDIILTEKSLICRERGIEIHCVADGEKLNFMDPVDLHSIFGNVLDNAIEEVQRFKRKEERQIDVLIFCQSEFLIINISNPLQEKLEFDGHLPRTTKGNNGYHGFGLKSVQHVVETYGGNLRIGTEGGIFSLKILIPLSEEM